MEIKVERERAATGNSGDEMEDDEEEGGEGEGNKTAADPSKRAKDDKPGTQGVYSDNKQDSGESKLDSSVYEHPESSGEKKVVQRPKPEAKENNPGATKTKG